jgi:septal ring factor EnvC (AmiA/AmiB activator)
VQRRIAAWFLGTVLLLAFSHALPESAKERDLRELRERIETLKKDLAAAEGPHAEAADELRESESAISEANKRLLELADERDRVRSELVEANSAASALHDELAVRQRALGRMLYARYTAGERGPVQVLLSGEDPREIARALVYQTYVSRTQAEIIGRVRADIERLAALQASARTKADELATAEARVRSEREALRAKARERRSVLARIVGEIRKNRNDLAAAQRNEGRLARLAEELARAAAPAARAAAPAGGPLIGEFATLRGRLRAPVRGELLERFGAGRSETSPSSKGVFFRAPQGGEVRAVASGRVVFADWMRAYGNLLIVDHGEGYLSIYGNNESVLRRVGDSVHAGEVVATVGASGGNETSGLYFELRHAGRPFDPVPWLQSR